VRLSTAAGQKAENVWPSEDKWCRAGIDQGHVTAEIMNPLSLPKSCLLAKSWEYQKVYKSGKRLKGRYFSLIYAPNDKECNRLGISVYGVKRAVRRNRIKRIIREFFRHNRNFIRPPVDIVFAVREGFAPDSPQEVEGVVNDLLERAKMKSCREKR